MDEEIIYTMISIFGQSIGCGLAPFDLKFILKKVLRLPDGVECDQKLLNWAQLVKRLPNQNFNFWDWFFSVVKITRDHLNHLWRPNKRLIHGFITLKDSIERLKKYPNGTFLIRFSESQLGCVTIVYKTEHRPNQPAIVMLGPWNSDDLKVQSIHDRIREHKQLKFLYPKAPKETIFAEFYGPVENDENRPSTSQACIQPNSMTQMPNSTPSVGNSSEIPPDLQDLNIEDLFFRTNSLK